MKRLFWPALLAWALLETASVYLIMPLPGSQRMDSLAVAYALHAWRWPLRVGLALLIGAGAARACAGRGKWLALPALVSVGTLAWFVNERMSADHMFLQPAQLTFAARAECGLDDAAVVLGVEHAGEARAYPMRYLVYHHQVQDTVGGEPVLVTYCSVCRTGRVYSPVIDGRRESFRLVGMDHFNAMLEDRTTGSWWRQATGEAVAGPLTGARLTELDSAQGTLGTWCALHPDTLVMLPDESARDGYDADGRYERGESRSALTGTDPGSWSDKSWVVGVELGGAARAWDWNRLKSERVINDVVGGRPIVLVLAPDGQSFAAFARPDAAHPFAIDGDVLSAGGCFWDLAGRSVGGSAQPLEPVAAHQEFWHSWRTFHPGTTR